MPASRSASSWVGHLMPWAETKWDLTQAICHAALIKLHVGEHVPPAGRDTPVTHQPGDLVGALRGQRPKVPLNVVVAQVVVGTAFLGADEVLKLHRIADEKHRGVVADDVQIALGG